MSYKSRLKEYRPEMLKTLRDFVSIPSVYDENTKSEFMPFGADVASALEFVAKLGIKNGFVVDRCDGYATELTIGNGPIRIGVYAHADVVPVSGNWKYGPFDGVIEGDRIYGRGTSDDKGPFVAAFYAIKALNDEGLLKNVTVTLVAGGDEERGSSCLDYYFNNLKKESPNYGFTPDSDFPLIYGEKGISDFFPEIFVEIPHVLSIKGGVATNAVCDRVEIKLDDVKEVEEYCKENSISYEVNGDLLVIFGKSAHGSTPEIGDNAALKALSVLGNVYKIEELTRIADGLKDTSGKTFGGFTQTKLLGKTTYCVGLINYESGLLKFSVNFRYPEKIDRNIYKDKFDSYFGTISRMGGESPYLLYDPNTKLVKTLLKAYRRETFDFRKPLTTGGGTYAKHCKNTIAFGALFPNRVSSMHEPNEFMPLKDIYKSAEIYATAIKLLGKLK